MPLDLFILRILGCLQKIDCRVDPNLVQSGQKSRADPEREENVFVDLTQDVLDNFQ